MGDAAKKVATVISKANYLEPKLKTAMITKSVVECEKGAKALDIEKDDLGYLLKHKETKDGGPLSLSTARAASMSAAGKTGPLLEAAKALKALLPAKKKEEA